MEQLDRERLDLLVSRFESFDYRCRRKFVDDFFRLYREERGEEAYGRLLGYVAGFLYSGDGDPVLGCLRGHYVGKSLELIGSFSRKVRDISKVSRQLYKDLVNERREGLLR